MSENLSVAALRDLKELFRDGLKRFSALRCVIVHSDGPDAASLGFPPLASTEAEVKRGLQSAVSRIFGPNPPRIETQADLEKIAQDCNPLDPAQEWNCTYGDVRGLKAGKQVPSRHVYFMGEAGATDAFLELADRAGECLAGLPQCALARFPGETLKEWGGKTGWLWALFDLAWQQRADSPLNEQRWAWKGMEWLPYDADKGLNYYFSEIPDLFLGSTRAIDILLQDCAAATAPPESKAADPDDRITAGVASCEYIVSENTVRRYVREHKLPDLRETGHSQNAKVITSRKAVAGIFKRR